MIERAWTNLIIRSPLFYLKSDFILHLISLSLRIFLDPNFTRPVVGDHHFDPCFTLVRIATIF